MEKKEEQKIDYYSEVKKFEQLVNLAGSKKNGWIKFGNLWLKYKESHRKYHTYSHVMKGAQEIESVIHIAENPIALKIGNEYHDYFYDTQKKDNEKRSAEQMKKDMEELNIDVKHIEDAERNILATIPGYKANTLDQMLMQDIDLSIFGQSPAIYDAYRNAIREEYSWVKDEEFVIGRKKIMEMFFQKAMISSVYNTEFFRNKINLETGKTYDEMAKENLKKEIDELEVKAKKMKGN